MNGVRRLHKKIIEKLFKKKSFQFNQTTSIYIMSLLSIKTEQRIRSKRKIISEIIFYECASEVNKKITLCLRMISQEKNYENYRNV
jgi:hypothetical protein